MLQTVICLLWQISKKIKEKFGDGIELMVVILQTLIHIENIVRLALIILE
jgi:hypothetical protein